MYKFCPHCGGNLPTLDPTSFFDSRPPPASSFEPGPQPNAPAQSTGYDQTAVWKKIVAEAPENAPRHEEVVKRALAQEKALIPHVQKRSSIVHLLFDAPVTPLGGSLQLMLLQRATTDAQSQRALLVSHGYFFDGNDKVATDERGTPIGKAYLTVKYWGGDKQHKRWHLAKPVAPVASRHGNPSFMDDTMVAFVAQWKDGEKVHEALEMLLNLFEAGDKFGGPARARSMHLVWT